MDQPGPPTPPLLRAEVEFAEPVFLRRLSATPNDPFFPAQAATSGLWFLDRIAAPAAWDVTTGSPSVGLAATLRLLSLPSRRQLGNARRPEGWAGVL